MYRFPKEMDFDLKAQGKKSIKTKTLRKILESRGLMNSASGVSKTNFLSFDPHELCEKLNFLLQEKQVGNNSDKINEEIVVLSDNL